MWPAGGKASDESSPRSSQGHEDGYKLVSPAALALKQADACRRTRGIFATLAWLRLRIWRYGMRAFIGWQTSAGGCWSATPQLLHFRPDPTLALQPQNPHWLATKAKQIGEVCETGRKVWKVGINGFSRIGSRHARENPHPSRPSPRLIFTIIFFRTHAAEDSVFYRR